MGHASSSGVAGFAARSAIAASESIEIVGAWRLRYATNPT